MTRVPHLSPLLRKVGTTTARSAVLALGIARVERLLSAAFDLAPDLDFDPARNRPAIIPWKSGAFSAQVKFEKMMRASAPEEPATGSARLPVVPISRALHQLCHSEPVVAASSGETGQESAVVGSHL